MRKSANHSVDFAGIAPLVQVYYLTSQGLSPCVEKVSEDNHSQLFFCSIQQTQCIAA